MKEVDIITSGEKLAIINAIDEQFKNGNCLGFVEYNPLVAQDYLTKTGDLDEYEIDVHRQFEILRELASDRRDIEIDFLKIT